MAWDSNVSILRNEDGDPIPQVWNDATQEWTAYASIPEYQWLSTDVAVPAPAAGDRAFGVEINAGTHVMTVKYWTGAAWEDLA